MDENGEKTTRHGFVWWLSAFSAIGGLYEGYAIGHIAGITLQQWKAFDDDFNVKAHDLMEVFLLAAALGAVPAAALADIAGRKAALAAAAAVATAAGILMAATPTHTNFYLVLGRGFSGLASGALSVLVPLYQSEVAPAALRGKLMTTFQLAITIGIAVSCLIAYLLEEISPLQEASWRLALLLQVVPATVLALGTPFIPESPRWHMLHSRENAARRELFRIRKSNKLEVLQELHEMRTYARHHACLGAVVGDEEPERSAYHRSAARMAARILSLEPSGAPSVRATPLVLDQLADAEVVEAAERGDANVRKAAAPPPPPPGGPASSAGGGPLSSSERWALALATWLNVVTQLTGINAIMYFAEAFSRHFSGMPLLRSHTPLFTLSLLAAVNMAGAAPLTFLIDRFGRRKLLTRGAVGMAACWAIESVVSFVLNQEERAAQSPHAAASLLDSLLSGAVAASSRMLAVEGAVAPLGAPPPHTAHLPMQAVFFYMLLIIIAVFSLTWSGVVWVTTCELVPARWHAVGTAIAVATNWLSNFAVATAVAYTSDIPFSSTLISAVFCLCCIAAAISTHWWVPETKLLSLENIESAFALHAAARQARGGRWPLRKAATPPRGLLSGLLPTPSPNPARRAEQRGIVTTEYGTTHHRATTATERGGGVFESPEAGRASRCCVSPQRPQLPGFEELVRGASSDMVRGASAEVARGASSASADTAVGGISAVSVTPSLEVCNVGSNRDVDDFDNELLSLPELTPMPSAGPSRTSTRPNSRLGAHTPSEAMWPEEAPLPELVAEDAAARKKRVHSPHSDSALVLLCALDAWLSVLAMFVVALRTLVLLSPPPSEHVVPANATISAASVPPAVFEGGVWALATSVNLALLGLFFLRDWGLVLFLWKLFHTGMLLVQLTSACVGTGLSSPPRVSTAAATGIVAAYTLYTMVLLREVWRLPRVREHYRRLPTRREAPADVGYLQFGSFFFRRQDVVGVGGSARVYKGMYAGQLVAVKELDTARLAAGTKGLSEAALLSKLRHPFVLHFFGCCVHESHLYLVTELCDTSLQQLLERDAHNRVLSARSLPLQPRLSLALQIAEGVQYLHENGVVHRDLKPANILLALDARTGGLVAKIGDFGLSRTTDSPEMTALIGTVQYMAPEVLNGTQNNNQRFEYTAAVDIFSFAVILWQLLTSAEPYESAGEPNRFRLLQRIAQGGLRPDVPVWVAPSLSTLLAECWAEAEHERPSSAELVRRLRLVYATEFGADWRASEAQVSAGTTQARNMLQWRQSFPR